jgi:hypothetical protein
MSVKFFLSLFFIIPVNFIFSEDADLLWRAVLGGAALSTPHTQLQSVVVLCEGNTIKAFSSSGKNLWEYKSRRKLLPYISRSRTAITYICGTNGDFSAINRAGRVLWTIRLKEPVVSEPLSGWDDRIFVSLKNAIRCYTTTGSLLWKNELAGSIALNAFLDEDGGIITVLDSIKLIRINAFGKAIEIKLKKMPFAALSLSKKRILVVYTDGALELYRYDDNGIDILDDDIKALEAAPIASSSSNDVVAFQLHNERLVLWLADKNDTLWTVRSSPGIGTPGKQEQKTVIKWDDNREKIYVLSISGAICFSKDGLELWNMRIDGAGSSPAFDEEDGLLYSSGRDWILYTYSMEKKEMTNSGQLDLPPLGNYGLGKKPTENEEWKLRAGQEASYEFMLKKTRDGIVRGNVGEAEVLWVRTLIDIAGDTRAVNRQRLEALRLLGTIGSREIIPCLIGLLEKENQPMIQAEIITALGKIGVDPGGKTLAALSNIIYKNRMSFNDVILFSAAGAIGNLCRFSGPPSSGRGIELLSTLAAEPSMLVSRKARQELETLWDMKSLFLQR